MNVYVVLQTSQMNYDPKEYISVYGVYSTLELADKAVEKCRRQKYGTYYAEIYEEFLSEE
jgi:hypothetical protein